MLLGSDLKNPPAEENIEALCQFLATVGKQLEESSKSTNTIDPYFNKLKEYSTSTCFASRIRFLIKDTVDLRANKWIPRREVVRWLVNRHLNSALLYKICNIKSQAL